MKILGFILAFLFLSSAAFVGITGAHKARKAGAELAQVTAELGDSPSARESKMLDELPSAGRLNAGGIVGYLAAAGALVLFVAAFVKKSSVPGIAAATVGLSAIAAAVLPHVETGPLDGAAPRMQAVITLILVSIGAAGAMLAARRKA